MDDIPAEIPQSELPIQSTAQEGSGDVAAISNSPLSFPSQSFHNNLRCRFQLPSGQLREVQARRTGNDIIECERFIFAFEGPGPNVTVPFTGECHAEGDTIYCVTMPLTEER